MVGGGGLIFVLVNVILYFVSRFLLNLIAKKTI